MPLRRRSPFSRLSAAHLLMVLAAVLAFAVNLVVLRSHDETVAVVAMATEVATGATVTPADFQAVEVDVSPQVLGALLIWEQVGELSGKVAARTLLPGELASRAAFIDPASGAGRRAMSVPIDPAHAVGGAIVAGDRIDLIHVGEAGATYVIVDAEVLTVNLVDRASLGGSAAFSVVIAVESSDALAVAAAIRDGEIEIVRSTGAPPIEVPSP